MFIHICEEVGVYFRKQCVCVTADKYTCNPCAPQGCSSAWIGSCWVPVSWVGGEVTVTANGRNDVVGKKREGYTGVGLQGRAGLTRGLGSQSGAGSSC